MIERIWRGRLAGVRLVALVAMLALLVIGLANIYAATAASAKLAHTPKRQLMWIVVGFVCFVLINLPHYRRIARLSYVLYALALLLLLTVLVGKYLHLGRWVPPIYGAYRWINLYGFRIQPSEIAKLAYILALAWYLRQDRNHRTFAGLLKPFALALAPMALILLQPDLGTTLLFLPILFAVIFTAGARAKHLITIALIGAALSPVFYFSMRPYQRERVQVLLRQGSDDPYWLRGPGFQLHESKIWIASGQATGQGWRSGPVVKYRTLPHHHNDFIFALIAHQWGFVGAATVLVLFAVIILCGLEIALQQSDPCGRLLAVGIATLFLAQAFINVGVTVGVMPVTGMTLPFVSYGGSSLVANFLALGLLFNVARHRPRQLAPDPFQFDDDD